MTNKQEKNIYPHLTGKETHWFLRPRNSAVDTSYTNNPTRLNNLDSKIVEEKSAIKTGEEPLSIDFRIGEKEKSIAGINNEIKIHEKSGNMRESFSLRVKKVRLEKELQELYREYNAKDVLSKTTDLNAEIIKSQPQRKMPVINSIKKFIKRHILARVSKRFQSIVMLGDSLDALASINQNVDELMKLKSPYGENTQNYQKLTEYLYRAHKIRAQINRSMKK